MPSPALDLFDAMLELDPSKRVDADNALKHIWLRNVDPDRIIPPRSASFTGLPDVYAHHLFTVNMPPFTVCLLSTVMKCGVRSENEKRSRVRHHVMNPTPQHLTLPPRVHQETTTLTRYYKVFIYIRSRALHN